MNQKPVLTVSHKLNYEITLPDSSCVRGYVSERGPFDGKRIRVATVFFPYRISTTEMVKREFENMLYAHGVLADDSNRADLGPLPGRYVGHPWAVQLADAIAVEHEVKALLDTVPESVKLQCYHNGEGDEETIAMLPFDGWEQVHQWVRREAGPWNGDQDCYGKDCSISVVMESFVGADVVRLMRAREAASPALCCGELRWRIDSGMSEQEAYARRMEVKAMRARSTLRIAK
jgi:hypothetical protein